MKKVKAGGYDRVCPDFSQELQVIQKGMSFVAGVDEVGRGPLAGPVVVAAVILDPENLPSGIEDSKCLTAKRRAILYQDILLTSISVSVASISAASIDKSHIGHATFVAMRKALLSLAVRPSYALIDGLHVPPDLFCPALALVKGDCRSISIAAASIVAKVVRDRMMLKTSLLYPDYGFEQHVGYGTLLHRTRLKEWGPIAKLHRYSYAPVRASIKSKPL